MAKKNKTRKSLTNTKDESTIKDTPPAKGTETELPKGPDSADAGATAVTTSVPNASSNDTTQPAEVVHDTSTNNASHDLATTSSDITHTPASNDDTTQPADNSVIPPEVSFRYFVQVC